MSQRWDDGQADPIADIRRADEMQRKHASMDHWMEMRWTALLTLAGSRDASGEATKAIAARARWADPVALHDEHGQLALVPRWAAQALGAEMQEKADDWPYPVAVVKIGVKEKPR